MTHKEELIVTAIWGSETPRIGKSLPVDGNRQSNKNPDIIVTAKLNAKLTARQPHKKRVS